MSKVLKAGLLALALIPVVNQNAWSISIAPTITIDDVNDAKPSAAGLSSFTSAVAPGSGALINTEIYSFTGGFFGPGNGGAKLLVLTEPGTGTSANAKISDILLYGVTPNIPGIVPIVRAVTGVMVSFDGNEPALGGLSGLVLALSQLRGALPAGLGLPTTPFVLEETGQYQDASIANSGLTVQIRSGVPDTGNTLALFGLSAAAVALIKRRV